MHIAALFLTTIVEETLHTDTTEILANITVVVQCIVTVQSTYKFIHSIHSIFYKNGHQTLPYLEFELVMYNLGNEIILQSIKCEIRLLRSSFEAKKCIS